LGPGTTLLTDREKGQTHGARSGRTDLCGVVADGSGGFWPVYALTGVAVA